MSIYTAEHIVEYRSQRRDSADTYSRIIWTPKAMLKLSCFADLRAPCEQACPTRQWYSTMPPCRRSQSLPGILHHGEPPAPLDLGKPADTIFASARQDDADHARP